jgi:hypothetical protein
MNKIYINTSRYWQTKKRISSALIVLLLMLSVSCKKYLDAKSDSKEEIPSTIQDCQDILSDYTLYNDYPIDGENSSDDFYLSDGTFGGQQSDDQEIYEWSPIAMHLTNTNPVSWANPYNGILYANVVLDTYAKFSAADQASVAGLNVKGQALFFRSGFFYELAQLYAKPYNATTAGQDLGIPLRMTSALTEKLTRATVQQTYDQIINDLKTAIPILPNFTSLTSAPTKAAGYAELARVYLAKGDYTNALVNASACLNIKSDLLDYNTVVPNYYAFTTFPNSNKEVIFNTETVYNAPAGSSFIDSTLVMSYDTSDLRRKLFCSSNGDGTFTFLGTYSGDYNYFTGLAVDEVYLIKAECEARAGSTSDALKDLNTLLVTRYKTGKFVPVTATSADDALSKILIERRKELIYRGTRWADLRRLNQDPRFAITLTRNINGTIYTLPPNDLRYTLLIPYYIIQYGGYQQNPRN